MNLLPLGTFRTNLEGASSAANKAFFSSILATFSLTCNRIYYFSYQWKYLHLNSSFTLWIWDFRKQSKVKILKISQREKSKEFIYDSSRTIFHFIKYIKAPPSAPWQTERYKKLKNSKNLTLLPPRWLYTTKCRNCINDANIATVFLAKDRRTTARRHCNEQIIDSDGTHRGKGVSLAKNNSGLLLPKLFYFCSTNA